MPKFQLSVFILLLVPYQAHSSNMRNWDHELNVWVHMQNPSFDCKKASTKVEQLICKEDSRSLRVLDNQMALFYSMLNRYSVSNTSKQDQLKWLRERNECQTEECVTESYKKRREDIFAQLLQHFKNKSSQCNKDRWVELFETASTLGKPTNVARRITIFEGKKFDLDSDRMHDLMFSINDEEDCRATNCGRATHAVINLENCFRSVPFYSLRSGSTDLSELDRRLQDAHGMGNYFKNVKIISSYNASGCAGMSGQSTYSALSRDTLRFETFAGIEQDCGEETKFWTTH